MRLAALALLVTALAGLGGACSSGDSGAGATDCEPGKEVYCRCKNLDEGTQICRDDGSGYDACEPCFDDYEDGDDYGFPEDDDVDPPPRDGGADAASTCGNGQLDPDESCDDGNDVSDDGCDACVAGGNPLTGTACPGITVHLWSSSFELEGSSEDAGDAYTGLACEEGATGAGSPDRVYTVIPHTSGSLVVDVLSSSFDVVLFARTQCEDSFTQIACGEAGLLEVNTVEGVPVVLTVDGARSGQRGMFRLRLTPTAD